MKILTVSAARTLTLGLVCGSVLLVSTGVRAAEKTVRIKLATIVPTGSSYHKSLLKMRDKWRQTSGGAVDVIIYEGNKAGGETETIGLMQADQLQASLLTSIGLSEIEPTVAGLQSMPMAFKSLEEVDYVGEKLQPLLEKRLLEKGYVVLFWTDAGWVRFFSTKPVVHPDDLKKMKLFTWAGNAAQVEIYKAAGLNPVPLETADVVPGFTTGLIEAIPMPPFAVLGAQIDGKARHMLDLNWAPLVGALVITKKAWDKIPESAKEALRAAAAEAGKENKAAGRTDSEESVKRMKQRGLTVHEITPEIETEWRKTLESVRHLIRGKIVPAEIDDEVQRLIKEYRARNTATK
jgi:TRAP-type C4-dicarboxylate transport system substrate-binding protein